MWCVDIFSTLCVQVPKIEIEREKKKQTDKQTKELTKKQRNKEEKN